MTRFACEPVARFAFQCLLRLTTVQHLWGSFFGFGSVVLPYLHHACVPLNLLPSVRVRSHHVGMYYFVGCIASASPLICSGFRPRPPRRYGDTLRLRTGCRICFPGSLWLDYCAASMEMLLWHWLSRCCNICATPALFLICSPRCAFAATAPVYIVSRAISHQRHH